MRLFQTLVLALSLAVLSAQSLSAQPPLNPPPDVELQDVFVVGSDLGVTFDWSADLVIPSTGAQLVLLDSQGYDAGSIYFTPVYGPQTVWIPGGATLRASDLNTWPLSRRLELITASLREIVVEKNVSVYAGGPVVILSPRWPLPYFTGRQCFLHLVSLFCEDPEDYGGDDLLLLTGFGDWSGPANLKSNQWTSINQAFLLCDTCQNIDRRINLQLWDLDDFDPDDNLGSHPVSGCSSIPLSTLKYSGEGWTHYLQYRVSCSEETCPQ